LAEFAKASKKMTVLISAGLIGLATYLYRGQIPLIKISNNSLKNRIYRQTEKNIMKTNQNYLEFLWDLKSELSTGTNTDYVNLYLPEHKLSQQLRISIVNCLQTGAALTPTINRLIKQLKNEIEQKQVVDAELASTKATIAILAALPVFGLLLSGLLSGNSIHWLIGSSTGRICLLIGGLLNTIGIFWVRQIVKRALAN
jgi:hypothetical protein